MACFLSLWLIAATWIGAIVGLGLAWWLIKWVKVVELWRSAWFMGFDRAVEIGWVVTGLVWIRIGWFGGGVVMVWWCGD